MITLGACGEQATVGSGPTHSEARNVDSFSRIEVGNGIGLSVQIGGAHAVEVSAQENILPLVMTTVEDGTLRIYSTESFTTTNADLTVATTLPRLDGISISGGSNADIDGLDNDRFDIAMSGGGSLAATGRATTVALGASGGARADLETLSVEGMNIELSGGATATVDVSDQLTGTASGGAVATVTGGAELDVDTTEGAVVSGN